MEGRKEERNGRWSGEDRPRAGASSNGRRVACMYARPLDVDGGAGGAPKRGGGDVETTPADVQFSSAAVVDERTAAVIDQRNIATPDGRDGRDYRSEHRGIDDRGRPLERSARPRGRHGARQTRPGRNDDEPLISWTDVQRRHHFA